MAMLMVNSFINFQCHINTQKEYMQYLIDQRKIMNGETSGQNLYQLNMIRL